MGNVNQLVLCKDDYDTQEGFHNAIRDAIILLLNANYIMTVRYDEPSFGIVVIEYEHDDKEYGCRYPHWLLPEEFESVVWEEE